MKDLCVIGSGNMGKAMIKGIIRANLLKPSQIVATDVSEAKIKELEKELGVGGTCDNHVAAGESRVVVLAVKPQFYDTAISSIADVIKPETIIVSIVPGKTLERLEEKFKEGAEIVRAMPNIPDMVLAGMTAICGNSQVTEREINYVKQLFSGFGKMEKVSEYLMDVVVVVSGSSPAYVCLLIEAMADMAAKEGMSRQQAYIFSEQAVMGSAKLLLETEMHPGELKDTVCSPGGTSIEAVNVLEREKFRGIVI